MKCRNFVYLFTFFLYIGPVHALKSHTNIFLLFESNYANDEGINEYLGTEIEGDFRGGVTSVKLGGNYVLGNNVYINGFISDGVSFRVRHDLLSVTENMATVGYIQPIHPKANIYFGGGVTYLKASASYECGGSARATCEKKTSNTGYGAVAETGLEFNPNKYFIIKPSYSLRTPMDKPFHDIDIALNAILFDWLALEWGLGRTYGDKLKQGRVNGGFRVVF